MSATAAASVINKRSVAAHSLKQRRPLENGFSELESEDAASTAQRGVQCQQDRRQQFQIRRAQLEPRETPDQAIAHALLTTLLMMPTPDGDQGAVGREYRMAHRRWPDNLDLAWLSMQHCMETFGCDPRAGLHDLQTLDPDNAAVWMLTMTSAMHRKDEAGYERALQRAADANMYDARFGSTFLHAFPLLATLPPPGTCLSPAHLAEMEDLLGRPANAVDWASVSALALEFAVANQSYAALSECKEKARPLSASRRKHCMALLSRVADGDTLLEQTLARSLLVQLAGDIPGHAQLRERYRQLRWLTSLFAKLRLPDDYATRIWTDGEVATLRSVAIAQGHWPPPPDWLPEDARGRALIQTGRVPLEPTPRKRSR